MADKSTIDTYDKAAQQYGDSRDKNFWESQIFIFKKYLKEGKVLDIGCGTGRDTPYLIGAGFEYVGIDASEGMLEYAKKLNPTARYEKRDLETLGFEPESFDGFWAAAVLLHVQKKEMVEVLRGINRVVKSGGIGFISLKPKQNLEEGYITQEKWGGVKRFFSFYDSSEFKALAEEANFEVLEIGELTEEDGTSWMTFFVKKHD